MNMRRLIGVSALLSCVVATTAVAETACVSSATNARVEWQGAVVEGTSVRAYFRASNAKSEHYVEMTRDGSGRFWAVLPKVQDDAIAIEYRVATIDGTTETTQARRTVAVTTPCEGSELTVEQARATGRIVVGSTKDAPAFPIGFRCEGIIARITSEGVLVTERACSEHAIASAALVRQTSTANAANVSGNAATASPSGTKAGARNAAAMNVVVNEHQPGNRHKVVTGPPNRKPRGGGPNPPTNVISPKR